MAFKQVNAKTLAAVKAGDKVKVQEYSDEKDPGKRHPVGEPIEVPSNLDVAADRWVVINEFLRVPTICAADLTPADDTEAQ